MSGDALQVYIHVPFCREKCGYCAFYSEPAADPELVGVYLEHLKRDIEEAEIDSPVESLYFGGGTPSLLDERDLESLFAVSAGRLPLVRGAEITLEANPETLTRPKVGLIAGTATRISLGVQSFDAELRSRLGRRCSDRAIADALEWIADRGFPHCNCDLIYGVPGQTLTRLADELRRVTECGADHVSLYALTRAEGSALASDPGLLIDDDLAADMWDMAGEMLSSRGVPRYEISNYARPGGECLHNLRVWRGGRLLGFGPAAASYDGKRRYQEPASLARWLAGEPPADDYLPPERRRREIWVMNLRTVAGWRRGEFLSLPGATAGEWSLLLDDARRIEEMFPGTLEYTGDGLRLTERGLSFWDDLAAEWL